MDEMILNSGSISHSGKIFFVPREPHMIHGATLRSNIVFSDDYDPLKYDKVIHACGLKPIFRRFQSGDYQKIGDKSMNMTTEILHRISLARA